MFMACSLEVMYLCFHSRDMVLSYGQTPIPCNKLPSKFLWQQKCLYVAFAYAFSQTWYDWGSTWNGVRLHTDMPSSFRWQLSASRLLCISFHTWHLSACMWPCIYTFFQTCCVRVSTWLNLVGFTRISCDIMPSALRWQLSAIRWHCISFLSYLVLFGKHLATYNRVEPFWRREELGEGRIRATWGWISVDRGSKATLPLTMPRRVFKSSAKDSAHRPFGRELRGGRPQHIGRTGLANGTGPWGRKRP